MRSTLLALAVSAAPIAPLPAETPFRGDEIEDRDYEYDRDYFLNVFSFRLPYAWRRRWPWVETGFRGTAGSLRRNEFYLFQQMRVRPQLAEGLRFHFRYDEEEDFDSRYRRVEVGLEREIAGGISAELFGEILPEKEGDDMGLALWWRPGPRKYLRLVGILPDFIYNRKTEQGERYTRKPYTLRLEGEAELSDAWSGGFVVQENFPLELRLPESARTFRYRQFKARGHIARRLPGASEIAFDAAVEDTGKAHRFGAGEDDRDLHRFAAEGGVEMRHAVGCLRFWYGARFFKLWESARYLERGASTSKLDRREGTVYAGGEIPIWSDFRFRPEVLFMVQDNAKRFPNAAGRDRNDEGVQAKLSLGVLWEIADTARALINPTVDLDEPRFGGGQVALQIEL